MKNFLSMLCVLGFLTGCINKGVVVIPSPMINDTSIQLLSKKYTQAICTSNDVEINVAGCIALNDLKDGSWLKLMRDCAVVGQDPAQLKNCQYMRDQIINELLLIIDHHYHIYEGNLVAGKARTNFSLNALRLSLESAASLMTPTGTIKILAGLAALTGSVQTSMNEEFYFKNTIDIIITQMRTERKLHYVTLANMQKKEYRDYGLATAMRDLNNYYIAGTAASAIVTLQTISSAAETKAQCKVDKINDSTLTC